ncbi:transcription regulator BACH1 [Pelobates cultripes]|uniref:Transcription regulator BACH1 n=1 Tax=Pelobates cultripes TaxID=61616 RepID=A0AAD1TLC4_PELCU|nr:transcription regulator BACH1 [Pelobates cultripes]
MEACFLNSQSRMSYSEKKDAPFAYESSVYCKNLLLRLNTQREQGLLCDVTIVVEDQRFQAHRAVLAACSDYFLSHVVQPCNGDFIITLPEEVTVKGFGPLLQFAYTSRLLVNKDNLSDIKTCAKILEIHDIEETCFQFLTLKYLDNKPQVEPQDFPRKKCCKSFCPKASLQRQQDDGARPQINEVEELWREEFPANLKCATEIENLSTAPQSPKRPCETLCFGKENSPGFSSLCPKYRKFQKACKIGRIRSVSTCSSNLEAQSPMSVRSSESSENITLLKSQENSDDQLISISQTQPSEMERIEVNTHDSNLTYHNLTCVEEKTCAKLVFPPCFTSEPRNFNSVPFPCTYPPYRNVNYVDMPNNSNAELLPEKTNQEQDDNRVVEYSCPKVIPASDLCVNEERIVTTERSNVEREVAEHLAKGFWPDLYGNELASQPEMTTMPTKETTSESNVEKRPECPWIGMSITESTERTFTTLNSVTCPFISTFSNDEGTNMTDLSSGECIQSKQQVQCPYECTISLDGDSETDSEEDSVGSISAKELECEKLPVNSKKIISLSRYDFQSLVKTHNLTPEQLDCIHDIRRRSKNRIAAQRCRKRKLDCIQNLETEIRKLQNEKQHLLKERDQILSTLGETKQNLSGLCQQVCLEAALSRDQIQILAKYSSSECPLTFLMPEKDKMHLQCESVLQTCTEFGNGLPSQGPVCRSEDIVERKILQNMGPVRSLTSETALLVKSSCQSGIIDFCQQMTDKCTTDELQ